MPKCFVVMGFGEKTDPGTGRLLNLDATYHSIIKPAATEAGYECVRADEILHSGVIDIPMYEMLLVADLVVADVSTSNLNAMFELGVRYALKPRSTIVIAESKFNNPFDVNHIIIRKYMHLGPDIGFSEVGRMRQDLAKLMKEVQTRSAPDSPIYSLLASLKPPTRKGTRIADQATISTPTSAQDETYASQWQEAMNARAGGDFRREQAILRTIYETQAAKSGEDDSVVRPRVIRELAFASYKIGDSELSTNSSAAAIAYDEAISLLEKLDPAETTDPETLGLWSGVHKRRSALPGRPDTDRMIDLDTAIYAAERGFLIRQDCYTGINLAYLFDLRASISSGDSKIADRVFADRVRKRVVDAAHSALRSLPEQFQQTQAGGAGETAYWAQATLAEALIGLNDPRGASELEKARQAASATWMIETTLRQIEDLKKLREV